ncbi:hypothetical protein, partial [Peptoniphilus asaccharolyticus]
HSQTAMVNVSAKSMFCHYIKLHHSQTSQENRQAKYLFCHYIKLHHSQTSKLKILLKLIDTTPTDVLIYS